MKFLKFTVKIPSHNLDFRFSLIEGCELNAFYITRNFFDKYKGSISHKYPQLNSDGVYILYRDYPDFGKNLAYIGKATNVMQRLTSHTTHSDKENRWKIALLFVTNNPMTGLDDGDISYLEYAMIKKALSANFAYLDFNTQHPKRPKNNPKHSIPYLNNIVKYINDFAQLFGFRTFHNIYDNQHHEKANNKTFKPKVSKRKTSNHKHHLFEMYMGGPDEMYNAYAIFDLDNNSMVLKRGSRIKNSINPSFRKKNLGRKLKKVLRQLASLGIIRNNIISKDLKFDPINGNKFTPNSLASFTNKGAINARTHWKTNVNGRILRLKDIDNKPK